MPQAASSAKLPFPLSYVIPWGLRREMLKQYGHLKPDQVGGTSPGWARDLKAYQVKQSSLRGFVDTLAELRLQCGDLSAGRGRQGKKPHALGRGCHPRTGLRLFSGLPLCYCAGCAGAESCHGISARC